MGEMQCGVVEWEWYKCGNEDVMRCGGAKWV